MSYWFRTVLQIGAGCLLIAAATGLTSPPLQARVLESMQTQKVVPGELLRYPIVWRAEPGRRVQILLGRAPADARLVVNGGGNLFVLWHTTQQMPAETLIEIVAMDVDSGEKLDTKHLLVRALEGGSSTPVATRPAFTFDNAHTAAKPVTIDEAEAIEVPALPEAPDSLGDSELPILSKKSDAVDGSETSVPSGKPVAVSQSALTDSSEPVMDNQTAEHDAPVMAAIANQVVSAGRVVSLRINATIANGTQPVIQIDRLPGNASFDSNSDGSRTFYWQTGDRDQGEHLFRFTAINPNEAYLRDQQEVMIIVGDPSRNKTRPAQPLSSSIQ